MNWRFFSITALVVSTLTSTFSARSFAESTTPNATLPQPNKEIPNPNAGMFYAEATNFTFDKHLPDLFKAVQSVLVAVDYREKRVKLSFLIPTNDPQNPVSLFRVGWPYQEDSIDKKCGTRTIKATAPEKSTPYYKDFVITINDYLRNTCPENKDRPRTQIIFDTFEVAYNLKTQSTIDANELKPMPRDFENPWIEKPKAPEQATQETGI